MWSAVREFTQRMEDGGGEEDNDFSSGFLPPAGIRHLYALLGAPSLQDAFVPANHKQVGRSSGKLKR